MAEAVDKSIAQIEGKAEQNGVSPESVWAPKKRLDVLRKVSRIGADRVVNGFSRLIGRASKGTLVGEKQELDTLSHELDVAGDDASYALSPWYTSTEVSQSLLSHSSVDIIDGDHPAEVADELVEVNYDYLETGRIETHVDINLEEVRNGNVNTTVELVTMTAFADPSLWRDRTRGSPNSFGLDTDYDANGGGDTATVRNPQELWLASIYGFRTLPDTESEKPNAVRVEEVDYDTLSKMHEAFAGTVLVGEHTRIPVPTESLYPKEGLKNPLNNNYWLEKIRDGYWPIMRDHKDPSTGEFVYNEHDSTAIHLGNMSLLPREAQDVITEAATHELAWRQKYQAGEVRDKKLFLPGEHEYDDDPFSSGFRGDSLHDNGIMKIDNITDDPAYMSLLIHVVGDRDLSCADSMAALLAKVGDSEIKSEEYYAVTAIGKMSRQLGDLVNFNSRHRDGKNTTREDVSQATEAFLAGVVRVAEKIRGTYEESGSTQKKAISTHHDQVVA